MKNLYQKIIKALFKDEDIKKALVLIEELLELQGVDFTYCIYDKRKEESYSNKSDLNCDGEENEAYLEKRDGNNLKIKYNFQTVKCHIYLSALNYENIVAVKSELDQFIQIISKLLDYEIYKIHSFINPFFYDISRILYNSSHESSEVLEEFQEIVNVILGVQIIKIEKSKYTYFLIDEEYEDLRFFRYRDMGIVYRFERRVDEVLEIDKILNLVFYTLNGFLDIKFLEKKQSEFLKYQMESKENLRRLNQLLEKSLYKMTLISNLYKYLSRTREILEALEIVEKMLREEVDYTYLKLACGEYEIERGEKTIENKNYSIDEMLMEKEIEFKMDFEKENINHEDEVYLNLIFSHSKVELENMLLFKKINEMATIDGLTQLFMHRFFIENLEKEIKKSIRYKTPLALVMLDIDNFKNYNDTYGHLQGDGALFNVAKEIKNSVRDLDVPCRYGGEEFIVILPSTKLELAYVVAERIRENIEKNTDVTVSVGVTEYNDDSDYEKFIKRVDSAMYEAKKSGKNKVVRK